MNRPLLRHWLIATGAGLLTLGAALFLIKLMLEMAYFVAGGLALAGLAVLAAGAILRER